MHRNIQNYPTIQEWVPNLGNPFEQIDETIYCSAYWVSTDYGDYFPVVGPNAQETIHSSIPSLVSTEYGDQIPIGPEIVSEQQAKPFAKFVEAEYGDQIPIVGPTHSETVRVQTPILAATSNGDSIPVATTQTEMASVSCTFQGATYS